jgi:hypothetical protein
MSALCQKRTLLVDSFSSAARPDELVDEQGSLPRVSHDHSAGVARSDRAFTAAEVCTAK